MLGYSESELLQMSWSTLIHHDDVGASQIRKEQLWSGELGFVDAEIRFLHCSGAVVCSRIRVSVVHDESGKPQYFVLHLEDITARKRSEDALRESEDRFRIMADGCPTVMWVTDKDGGSQFVNRAFREYSGATYEDVEGTKWHLLLHPDDAPHYIREFQRAVLDHAPLRAEVRIRRADGEWRWLDSYAEPRFSDTGEFLGHVGLSPDITDRKQAEKILQSSEEKFRQLTENISEVFWMMNAAGTEMIYVSPAFEAIWGRPSESLYAHPELWLDSIHRDDRDRVEETLRRRLDGEAVESEYRIVQPSGAVRCIRDRGFPVRDSSGRIFRLAGVAEDTTDRKAAEDRLIHQALYDELTGLPNRRLFRDKLEQAVVECHQDRFGAVFLIDFDRFKLVNDTLGHSAGDQLLKQAAGRLLVVSGESGTLARFGGDEFALIATGFENAESVRELGLRLIRCLDDPFQIAGCEACIGASIGVSLFPQDGTDPEVLRRGADVAMHDAKQSGKNQLKFFTRQLFDAANERLGMETQLRRALALSEFKIQFQPQFAPGQSRPSRFEALVRWYPPHGQPIPPLKFIPIAEQNGLVVPIGTWVLGEACRQCVDWQEHGLRGTGVAVNVSALQFASPDFVDIVERTLATTRLPAHFLELEVTESVFVKDAEESARTLKRLRNLGVSIALDDFGTGYSSLSYLQTLPLDALKIDRSFLIEKEAQPQRVAMLRCIIELAHTLQLRVVGEGVETPAQLELLSSLGCDEIQGYLLGKPSFQTTTIEMTTGGFRTGCLASDLAALDALHQAPVLLT